MNVHTPAQIKAIQTWTEQRDGLLREIGIHSTELDDLKKSKTEHGLGLADLHKSIAEARGRLAEIDAIETRSRTSLPNDIAELEIRKSRLQGECSILDERLKSGKEKYEIITTAIVQFEAIHQTMRDQAQLVNSVVGDVIRTSEVHTSDMKVIMDNMRIVSDSVIAKSNENIEQANIAIGKMPKFIFESQRPIPVRRTYPVGHPKHEATT